MHLCRLTNFKTLHVQVVSEIRGSWYMQIYPSLVSKTNKLRDIA